MTDEDKLKAITRPEAIGETRDLISDWIRAITHKETLERQVKEMQIAIAQTERRLGYLLTPEDAEENERFHIWFGDGLLAIQVRKGFADGTQYELYWRKRPTRTI